MTPELKDVIGNANSLFSMHPAPWEICTDEAYGYVADANGIMIFGGAKCEGYVSERDPEIVALVDTTVPR